MQQVTARLAQVVLDTTDARTAAEFWRQLMGLVYRSGHEPPPPGGEDDPDGRDWLNLRLRDGTPLLAFQQVSELDPATWPEHRVPQQLHLDLSGTNQPNDAWSSSSTTWPDVYRVSVRPRFPEPVRVHGTISR